MPPNVLQSYRTAPTAERYLGQNVGSAEAEDPSCRNLESGTYEVYLYSLSRFPFIYIFGGGIYFVY